MASPDSVLPKAHRTGVDLISNLVLEVVSHLPLVLGVNRDFGRTPELQVARTLIKSTRQARIETRRETRHRPLPLPRPASRPPPTPQEARLLLERLEREGLPRRAVVRGIQ